MSQLPLTLAVRGGGLDGTTRFVASLQKKFPLSEVKALNLSKDGGAISVVFSFKEFPQLRGNTYFVLKRLSKEQASTLNSLYNLKTENQ